MGAPTGGGTSGEIAEGVLPELLRTMYVGRRSGTLQLLRGDEEQSLRFRGGHIVNAHTNIVADRLGEMLVRRKLLSEADLARATEVVVREKRRLGEVLAELGLLDAGGLEDAIALHVHEMLARLFAWPDGHYAFKDDAEETSTGEVTLKLSTGELILEAVRAVRDPDVVRYALGDIDRVLALSSDPLLRFQKLTLSPTDGFVLSRIDGVASAREILQVIPLPVEETQKSLFGLLSTGVIEYPPGQRRKRDAAAPARPAREAQPAPTAAPTAAPAEAPHGGAAAAAAGSRCRARAKGARVRRTGALADRPSGPFRPEIRGAAARDHGGVGRPRDAQPLRGAGPVALGERDRGEGSVLPARQAFPPRRPPRRLARRSARQARGRVHQARPGLRHAARSQEAR